VFRFCVFALLIICGPLSWSNVNPWVSSLPIKSKFKADDTLQSRVDFWVDIYSYYTTSQGVFHNIHDPSLIYGEVDLTDIRQNSVLSESSKQRLSQKKIKLRREKLIAQFKIKNPKTLRLQMGLKDRMQTAMFLSGKYLSMMEKVFKEKGLPSELTRLVFVESSFNVFAQSKVGASGLWQIMPSVGRAEGYVQKYYDKRNHPYYATQLAANMLKKNYQSLQSWPLAITAYNHGLTGVKRMKNKVGSDGISDLIDADAPTKNWGFASENFYACFLAVLEIERNAKDFFGSDLIQSKPLKVQNIYLKIAMNKKNILRLYDGNLKKFKSYNPHLHVAQFKSKKYFPAGTPLIIPNNKNL
jgi:membrane-bound lytic murein transglycosylase D